MDLLSSAGCELSFRETLHTDIQCEALSGKRHEKGSLLERAI